MSAFRDYNAGNCLLTRKPASQYSISHQTAKLCWCTEWVSDIQHGWYTELGEDWLLASVMKYTIVTDHTWLQKQTTSLHSTVQLCQHMLCHDHLLCQDAVHGVCWSKISSYTGQFVWAVILHNICDRIPQNES